MIKKYHIIDQKRRIPQIYAIFYVFPTEKQQQLFSNIFKSAGTVLQYLQYCYFFALTFLLNPDPKQIIPMPETVLDLTGLRFATLV